MFRQFSKKNVETVQLLFQIKLLKAILNLKNDAVELRL